MAHDENVCERQNISIRKCLVAQLPLAFTIIAFAAVFIVYNSMEYGKDVYKRQAPILMQPFRVYVP